MNLTRKPRFDHIPQTLADFRVVLLADAFTPVKTWWHEAKGWTLMYRGGLLVGISVAAAFVLWQILAARRERARLEALVISRTRQIRQGEELFRSIFEYATEGIYQSSLDGHNLRANPAMARFCGYADPGQMQRELTDVAHQFYVQPGRRQEINAAVANDGAAVDWESEIRRRDGSTFWISESVRTVVDPASGQTVYQGSIVDVTARRETQAAREHARLAAEAANAAKSAFLTHVTHELRTPLTGILSNARVALRDGSLEEVDRARYALIASSGVHLLALIDEILDLSRMEAGHMELRPSRFSLDELLRTVTDAFAARAAEKRLEMRCSLDPLLPCTVQGDALRLRQVLDNLIGNAFKFTAQGSVSLDVRRTEAGEMRFEVTDTGVGIPAELCSAIFEPFRQVASPRLPEHSGVGLGLHISARLVRLMEGELRVASVPGEGSRFFFDLPLHGDNRDESEIVAAHHRPRSVREERTPSARATTFALPSPAEIHTLLTLSLEGDIVRLRERLKELAARDIALADFTREVEALAVGFRMDAISQFLTRISKQDDGASRAS